MTPPRAAIPAVRRAEPTKLPSRKQSTGTLCGFHGTLRSPFHASRGRLFLCAAAAPPAAGLDSSLRDARFCAVERFPIFAEACALVGPLRVVGAGARFFAPGFAACRADTLALLRAAVGFSRGVRFVGGICLADDSGNGPTAGDAFTPLSPHHIGVKVMGLWLSIAWASGIAAPRI